MTIVYIILAADTLLILYLVLAVTTINRTVEFHQQAWLYVHHDKLCGCRDGEHSEAFEKLAEMAKVSIEMHFASQRKGFKKIADAAMPDDETIQNEMRKQP